MSAQAPLLATATVMPPSTNGARSTPKLTVVSGAPIVLSPDTAVARTPRRESAKPRAAKSTQGGKPSANQSGGDAPSSGPGGASANSPSDAAPTVGPWASGVSDTRTAKPVEVSATSRRWGILRKGVVPNPAIMQVNDKVLQIIQTLRKPPEDRTESDIKLLYTWLMNQEKLSSLFTTMSEISAKKLCKEMEFMHLNSGDVVVNQGDKGNTCFILISGLVSIFVRSADDQKKYHRVTRASVDGSDSRRLMEQGLITFGAKVATLTPGATFGELCLIEPDSKRSATVIVDPAAQIANFIVLTAASYLRMTRSHTIEGTITDHIAFLQHTLLFRKWTKMQLMHLVNSMKQVTVPAGQYITHKGADAESFYLLLRGEAHECVRLMRNESSDPAIGENGAVQHCITVDLTFLGKFDVAGEYLAAEKKVVTCPVDIRAITDVDCLVLNRKLFNLHFGGKDVKKHAASALKKLRRIATQREMWRETRINQALSYPNLRVPITRKLMRLSGNSCMICNRDTHIAGDELCMELSTYHMEDEKKKKQSKARQTRSMSSHRISLATPAVAQAHRPPELPSLNEGEGDEGAEDSECTSSGSEDDEGRDGRSGRLGFRLVRRQWKAAERAGLTRPPSRPVTAPRSPLNDSPRRRASRELRFTSISHTQHVSKRMLLLEPQRRENADTLSYEVRRIRDSWPYGWRDLEPMDDRDSLPHFEKLYRNMPPKRRTAT